MGNPPTPALQAAQVLVGFTTSIYSLSNSLLLTHQQEWGTAVLRLAEFPGAGPASPWGSESMPGGPRADQSQSTVGGHHQSVKKIRIRMQETRGNRGVETTRTAKKGRVAGEERLSPAHLAQIRRIPAALFRPQLD